MEAVPLRIPLIFCDIKKQPPQFRCIHININNRLTSWRTELIDLASTVKHGRPHMKGRRLQRMTRLTQCLQHTMDTLGAYRGDLVIGHNMLCWEACNPLEKNGVQLRMFNKNSSYTKNEYIDKDIQICLVIQKYTWSLAIPYQTNCHIHIMWMWIYLFLVVFSILLYVGIEWV